MLAAWLSTTAQVFELDDSKIIFPVRPSAWIGLQSIPLAIITPYALEAFLWKEGRTASKVVFVYRTKAPIDLATAKRASLKHLWSLGLVMNRHVFLIAASFFFSFFFRENISPFFLPFLFACLSWNRWRSWLYCADWIARLKSRVWRKSTRSFSLVPTYRPRSSPSLGFRKKTVNRHTFFVPPLFSFYCSKDK